MDVGAPEETCRRLLKDMEGCGVKVDGSITAERLLDVYLLVMEGRVTEILFAIC